MRRDYNPSTHSVALPIQEGFRRDRKRVLSEGSSQSPRRKLQFESLDILVFETENDQVSKCYHFIRSFIKTVMSLLLLSQP